MTHYSGSNEEIYKTNTHVHNFKTNSSCYAVFCLTHYTFSSSILSIRVFEMCLKKMTISHYKFLFVSINDENFRSQHDRYLSICK